MIFVPRLLSRRNKKKNTSPKKKEKKTTASSRKRKVQGNYRIRSQRKRSVKDGGGGCSSSDGKKNEEKWVIYSLAGCPYCSDAEQLLKKNKKDITTVDFDKLSKENQTKVENLIKGSDSSFEMTFPRIFKVVKGQPAKFIGGFSSLSTLMS